MTDQPEERRRPSDNNAQNSGDSHSRLTSLLPTTGGGLQTKPKSSSGSNGAAPASDQKSLLGLDRLAAQKRQPQRQYRRSQDETPSHPGGVNREAQNRARDRERRHRQQRYHPYPQEQHDSRHRNDGRNNRDGRDYRGDTRDLNYRERDDRDYRGGGDRRDWQDYRRRDDYSRRDERGNDSYRRPDSSMPPPSYSQVTPSTQSSRPLEYSSRSFSHSRSSQRRRDDYSLDAPTPRRDVGGRNTLDRTPAPRRNENTSAWDIETPLPDRSDDVDSNLTRRPASDDSEFERHFYLAEDEGHYVQDQAGTEVDGDMGRFLFNNSKTRAREAEMAKKRQEGRFSARKSALQDDQHAWEENRLLSSGAAVKGEVSLDIRTEDDARVTLLVHQVKPPFLDGRVSFSDIREAVPTVKDSSSDFAKMAREGSATLRHLRENKEKNTMRQKFWELGGTRMGAAVGIKEEKSTDEDKEGTGESQAVENADGVSG